MKFSTLRFALAVGALVTGCASVDEGAPSPLDQPDDVMSISQALLEGCPEQILANPKISDGSWSPSSFQTMHWDLNGATFWQGAWWCGYQNPGAPFTVSRSSPYETPHCEAAFNTFDCAAVSNCQGDTGSCWLDKYVVVSCPTLEGGDPVGYVKNGETVMGFPENYAGAAVEPQLFSFWSSSISGGSPSEFSQGVTKNGTLHCDYMAAIGPAYLVLGIP